MFMTLYGGNTYMYYVTMSELISANWSTEINSQASVLIFCCCTGKMGYNLSITANGDSLSSFTLYQSRDNGKKGLDVGVYPVALFKNTQTNMSGLPVCIPLSHKICKFRAIATKSGFREFSAQC